MGNRVWGSPGLNIPAPNHHLGIVETHRENANFSSLGWSIVGIQPCAFAVAIHYIESRARGSDVGKPDDAGWMVVAGKRLTLQRLYFFVSA